MLQGTIVYMGNFSARSKVLFENWRKKFPTLVCPCHIKYGTKLVVTDDLGNNTLLVQFYNNRRRLAILYASDVHTSFEVEDSQNG